MRIISGSAKGRRLFAPKSLLIRPVADKVKGALFNILGSMEGARVLDLFAGTGSVGLEAASREAEIVVFVDFLPEALKLLERNLSHCKLTANTRIIRGRIPQALKFIPAESPYHFAFVDPPYDKDLIRPALEGLKTHKLIDAESTVIIEHSPREPAECEGYTVEDFRKYGQTYISFLRLNPQ
jgi:16S rRNA (guanine966-N2)-methyltransferase